MPCHEAFAAISFAWRWECLGDAQELQWHGDGIGERGGGGGVGGRGGGGRGDSEYLLQEGILQVVVNRHQVYILSI